MKGYLIILYLLFCSNTFSQKQFNVLDWKSDATVNTYLLQNMHQQYEARKQIFEKALHSKEALLDYIETTRKKFLNLLGSLPERSALNPKISGIIQQDGYRIEKIIYESFADHHVTANLYVPRGKGPFPAALLFCGHEDISKATESYQRTAILFANNGFVVLVVDPVSQSERYQLTDSKGKSLARGGTTEHTLLNAGSNLLGSSLPAYELWDNVRSLDYLVTRPEVDTSRIGCLGNSGGGMQTIYFSAFDQRVKVIAPCSYLANRERTLELTGANDGCAQIPGEGYALLEMSDYLIASVPKPVLILAGRYDFIDYPGTLASYNDLINVYRALAQPGKIKLFTYDDGHGISKPKREAAVGWFKKWLMNDSSAVIENDIKTLSEKELFCTTTGQVNTEYSNELSINNRNLSLFKTLETSRQKFLQQSETIVFKKIRELLSVENSHAAIDIETKGSITKDNIDFKKFIARKENEIPMPFLLVYPSGSPKKIIVWFHEAGKNKIADSSALMQSYLQQEAIVILPDIRGAGETEDKPELNDPKFYNKEYRNAMLALHIGETMVGQRTRDILNILEFIRIDKKFSNLPVELNASGITTIPALHAALLNGGVTKLNLYHSIKSFKEILDDPVKRNWYSYVIPDVLRYYDLPDLVKMIGKQNVKFW